MDTLEINGHKLKVGLRDLVWLVMLIISLVASYFASVNRYNGLSTSVETNKKAITESNAAIKEVNTRADTAASNATTAREKYIELQQRVNMNATQISDLIHEMHDLQPKVDKIDTNVLWLMSKQIERK